jgi:hypothetical protein
VARLAKKRQAVPRTPLLGTPLAGLSAGGPEWTARCLPRSLPVDTHGQVSCSIALTHAGTCDCSADGLAPVDPASLLAIRERLKQLGACDDPTTPGSSACDDYCACDLKQFTGAAFDTCLSQRELTSTGFCYVDPAAGWGSPTLTEDCAAGEGQLLRTNAPVSFQPYQALIQCTSQQEQSAPPPQSSPGAIGDPCVPADESRGDFSGFNYTEVTVDTGTPACASNVCLVANFNGRVTCPYGQKASPNPNGKTCQTTEGVDLTVPVPGGGQRPPENQSHAAARRE